MACNSTDANPLDIGFNFDNMEDAWTDTVQLGDSNNKRCANEKYDPANTFYKKTVMYPEILWLLKKAQSSVCAIRAIWIKNKSASAIRVYKVSAQKSVYEGSHLDADSKLLDNYSLGGIDVPIGTTGTAKTLSFKNNSIDTFSLVKMRVTDSGETGVDNIFQFSVDGGTVWKDESHGWITLATGLVAGNKTDYKIRTNIPNSGNVFYNHKAKIEFRISV